MASHRAAIGRPRDPPAEPEAKSLGRIQLVLADPHDRRATLVQLTERGIEVAAAVRKARAAEAESYFAVLGEADRAELARILRVLRR